MKIITREEARAKGLKRFFTGEPCLHGHVCERGVSNGYCVDCNREREQTPEVKGYRRLYRKENYQIPENKERKWEHALLKKFNLTTAEYYERLKIQNGACAICFGVNKNGRKLCVDHDHATGKVRGLLCNACNTVLGLLNENRELLGAPFVRYLDEWDASI
jgi:hypothetical protein